MGVRGELGERVMSEKGRMRIGKEKITLGSTGEHKDLMNVLWDGDELSRNELKTRHIGHTIAAVDFLVVERLFQVHGEGLRAAVAATVPCFRHRRCLRLSF